MRVASISTLSILACMAVGQMAQADILAASPDHFTLRQEAVSELPPDELWAKLVVPSQWWHPDHTYSGDADNLSLSVQAGGLWAENWADGSVKHGEVVFVKPGRQIRFDAPFGPLQQAAVNEVWTITIQPHGDGTKIIFDEVVNGSAASKLDELAPAVDYVKTEAIKRLAAKVIE